MVVEVKTNIPGGYDLWLLVSDSVKLYIYTYIYIYIHMCVLYFSDSKCRLFIRHMCFCRFPIAWNFNQCPLIISFWNILLIRKIFSVISFCFLFFKYLTDFFFWLNENKKKSIQIEVRINKTSIVNEKKLRLNCDKPKCCIFEYIILRYSKGNSIRKLNDIGTAEWHYMVDVTIKRIV